MLLSTLGLSAEKDVATLNWKGQTIHVTQYLPIEKKIELIQDVLNNVASNDSNFLNECAFCLWSDLAIIEYYTDIELDEEMDPQETYDMIMVSKLFAAVANMIPGGELESVRVNLRAQAESYYKYKSSALGIMESISADYSQMNFDASEIQQKLQDPENITLLKQVVSKLG